MKKLMNLAIAGNLFEEGFESEYSQVKNFLQKNGMDGLEIILYGDYEVNRMPRDLIYGHHLLYWPNWIDLWRGNEVQLMDQFEDKDNLKAYYGFSDRQGMLAYLQNEFEIAKELDVKYMVLHVSNVSFEEAFTCDYRYDDLEVMKVSLELINEVFIGQGPLLLFENLWLPGLNFIDVEMTKWFYDRVDYSNKGFLLDIAHLMGTARHIDTVDQGIDYVHEVLDDLGDLVDEIHGIHLSKTIAGPYLREDQSQRLERYRQRESFVEGFKTISAHIKAIDSHQPFDHPRIMEIINRVKPDYLVYEFLANDINELEKMLQLQQKFIQ